MDEPFTEGVLLDGRYRPIRTLGIGGMGRVYLVEDLLLGERAALKQLSARAPVEPERLELFLREASIAHAIHHPNVARTYDVGEHAGVPYLTMEWLEGETLRDRVKRAGPLPPAEVLRLAIPLCLGLRAAHRAGIVHRDLKPANVMLVPRPRRVVLMDFGISQASDPGREAVAAAREARRGAAASETPSTIRGTPAFMAPEQWAEQPVDQRTDLYALGCILFYALVGRNPFLGRTPLDLAHGHTAEPVPSVFDHLAGGNGELRLLDRVARRCMAKRPEDRPASADEVLETLRAPRRMRRYLMTVAAVAVAAVLAATGIHAGAFAIARGAVLRELRPSLERLATLIARELDAEDLARVRTPADMEGESFARVHDVLLRYKRENPEIEFVYTLRRIAEPHDYEFVVDDLAVDVDLDGDGEIGPHEDGSPPGTPFDGRLYPAMAETLETGRARSDDDFQLESWGTLISGYAPVLRDGRPDVHLVGVDVSHTRLARLRHGLVAVLAAAAVLTVVATAIIAYPRRSVRERAPPPAEAAPAA